MLESNANLQDKRMLALDQLMLLTDMLICYGTVLNTVYVLAKVGNLESCSPHNNIRVTDIPESARAM